MATASRTAFRLGISAAALAAVLGVQSAGATIVFGTGNDQYTNVNIVADVDALQVTGHIGATGVHMYFENMIAADGTTQAWMHGQHGAAFVESYLDSLGGTTHTGFSSLTLRAEDGYGFTAGDFALDLLNGLPSPNGFVTFLGVDQFGDETSTTLALRPNGQSHYNFTTADGELVRRVVITVAATDLLQDIKQVSVNVAPVQVPEPTTTTLVAAALAGLALLRGRRPA